MKYDDALYCNHIWPFRSARVVKFDAAKATVAVEMYKFGTSDALEWRWPRCARGEETSYLLCRRFMNYGMLARVKCELLALDADVRRGGGGVAHVPAFVALLRNAAAFNEAGKSFMRQHYASFPTVGADVRNGLAIDFFASLRQSQLETIQKMMANRLQVIWGPPGSGKTFLLAKFIAKLLFCRELTARPRHLNILISANTHSAIDTLMEAVAEQLKLADLRRDDERSASATGAATATLRLIKCGRRAAADDAFYARCGIERCTDERKLRLDNDKAAVHIVGATAYACAKFDAAWRQRAFDLLIIDEASQMLLPLLALAMRCLENENGKLILVGDHLQLRNNTFQKKN